MEEMDNGIDQEEDRKKKLLAQYQANEYAHVERGVQKDQTSRDCWGCDTWFQPSSGAIRYCPTCNTGEGLKRRKKKAQKEFLARAKKRRAQNEHLQKLHAPLEMGQNGNGGNRSH